MDDASSCFFKVSKMKSTREEKMIILSIIHFIIIHQHTTCTSAASNHTCQSLSCGNQNDLQIRFPFYFKDRKQPSYCGYPGYELSCTINNETEIQLPFSGAFLVRRINYKSHSLVIYDQNGCIPRRLIGFNLSNTPFERNHLRNYAVFNCSNDMEQLKNYVYFTRNLTCLSSSTNNFFALDSSESIAEELPSHCNSLAVPLRIPLSADQDTIIHSHSDSVLLNWDEASVFEPGKKIAGKKIAISVSLGSFVLVLFGMIIFIKLRNKANSAEKENQLKIEQFLEKNALKPTRYSHAELKKMTNKFETRLGRGGYGSVFEGKLTNGIQVAVKVLDSSEGSSNNGEEFVNEVATIGRIHHLNIVRLLGFCVEGSARALIYEFMSNSSLDKFIFSVGKDKTLINLGWPMLQEITVGIARGMEYLHQGCAQRILHFDIKPQNILLDHNFTPKISDFGLAKLCTKDTFVTISMAAARGTMGYIAPEVFSRNFGTVSYKSDVYSFGMLLLEMVGGGKKNTERKMGGARIGTEEYFPEWVYDRLSRGEDLGVEAEAEGLEIVKKLTMVALWCIQWNPTDRPSMNGVLHMLEGDTENLVMAPNPFASTSSSSVNRNNETELTVILED